MNEHRALEAPLSVGKSQNESLLTTSPPASVAMAYQVVKLTEFLMKWTEPSMNRTFTPPGWYELAATMVWLAPA